MGKQEDSAIPAQKSPPGPSFVPRLVAFAAVAAFGLAAAGCGPDDGILFGAGKGILRGTILDGLSPIGPAGQARVQLLGIRTASTFTRPDGTWELRDVPVGLYDLVADRDLQGANRRVRFRFIEVVGDQVIDLPDLALEIPGSLSGVARLRGAGVGNPQAPNDAGILVEVVGTTLRAVTAADGTWSIPVVEVGDYKVRFSRNGFIEAVRNNVAVGSGANTALAEVILEPLDPSLVARLKGRVLLEAAPGGDFAGVRVALAGTTRSLITTPGGFWAFDGLPIGTYDVSFSHPDYFDGALADQALVSGVPETTAPDLTLSNHRVLAAASAAGGLAVAPSSNQIAYLTDAGNGSEIALLSPNGESFNQVITAGARAAAGRGLEWTRDERHIVFTQFQGGAINAFAPAIVPDTGGEPRTLLASGTDYFVGTLSPDSRELAFYLTQNLQAVRIDRETSTGRTIALTSTIRTLAPGIGVVTELNGIEWAATGRLVYDREAGTALPSDVFTVLASGTVPPQRLGPRRRDPPADTGAPLVGRFQSPSFSPDASRVAFTVEPGSTDPEGIWIADVDGENAVQISTEAGLYLDWTAGGTEIFYVRLSDHRPCVLKVPRRFL